MEFGIFIMPIHSPEKPFQDTLKTDMDTVVLADSLGGIRGLDRGALHHQVGADFGAGTCLSPRRSG